jgi:hypothetical protein
MKADSTKGPKKKKKTSASVPALLALPLSAYTMMSTPGKNTPTEHMDKTKKKKRSKQAYRNPE